MIKQSYLIISLAVLYGMAPSIGAEELIKNFSGSRTTDTQEFDVRAPWILEWRVTGELSRVVAVDVTMFNAGTGAYEGTVLKTKVAGNGVKMFNESGRYYFRVDATMMNWTLKVIQLTKDEAALYTSKPKHILDKGS